MDIEITIKDEALWGDASFTRTKWPGVNYLVGPNGSGKTRFATQLNSQLSKQDLSVRYLNAERLTGLESINYEPFTINKMQRGLDIANLDRYENKTSEYGLATSAFGILREKIDVKIKVEAFISHLIGRTIRLSEEGGFLVPKMRFGIGDEYDLKSSECLVVTTENYPGLITQNYPPL